MGRHRGGPQHQPVEDTKAAIAAAKATFPSWSRSGILERHAILRKTADDILARKDELGRLLSREQGRYANEFYTTVKTAYTMA